MVIRKNTIIAIAKAIPANVSSPDITMNIHKIVRIIIGAVQPSGSHSGWPNCISAPFLSFFVLLKPDRETGHVLKRI